MATWSNFLDRLPDPRTRIGDGGQSGTGSYGPGFASVKLSSNEPVIKDKTNSGRHLARAIASHQWKVSISYNPMTREEFEPIYSFLLQKRGGLTPFYVQLPQYRTPQNVTFATYAATSASALEAEESKAAGATTLMIGKTGYNYVTNGTPKPGDMFVVEGVNSNHKKAYMVTRVETYADYQTGTTRPATYQVRIHFTPGLQRAVTINDDIVFHDTAIKVVLSSDIQSYSLDTNNLYSFSLEMEEVQ